MLSSESTFVKRHTLQTLCSLVRGINKNKVALLKADGLPILIKLFHQSRGFSELVQDIVSLLRNLSCNQFIAAEIAKGNVISKVVRIVKDSGAPASLLTSSINLLANLAEIGSCLIQLICHYQAHHGIQMRYVMVLLTPEWCVLCSTSSQGRIWNPPRPASAYLRHSVVRKLLFRSLKLASSQ